MIRTDAYCVRALENGRSPISICVFGAVHLEVEATLDPGRSKVSPPAVLVHRTLGDGGEQDLTAEECDGSCRNSLTSVRLTIELVDTVESEVRAATRELFSRIERRSS